MSDELRYWNRLARGDYTSAHIRQLIALANKAGVPFKDLGTPGSVWANCIDGPPLLKTVGSVHEVTDAPGTYRIVHHSDARRSDLGLLSDFAESLQVSGASGFESWTRRAPWRRKAVRKAKGGHLYVMCCRALTDYHHRELAAVAGIPDSVPSEWSTLLDSTN